MRRCPKCELVNPDSAVRCDCGFAFTQPSEGTASWTRLQAGVPREMQQLVRWMSITTWMLIAAFFVPYFIASPAVSPILMLLVTLTSVVCLARGARLRNRLPPDVVGLLDRPRKELKQLAETDEVVEQLLKVRQAMIGFVILAATPVVFFGFVIMLSRH